MFVVLIVRLEAGESNRAGTAGGVLVLVHGGGTSKAGGTAAGGLVLTAGGTRSGTGGDCGDGTASDDDDASRGECDGLVLKGTGDTSGGDESDGGDCGVDVLAHFRSPFHAVFLVKLNIQLWISTHDENTRVRTTTTNRTRETNGISNTSQKCPYKRMRADLRAFNKQTAVSGRTRENKPVKRKSSAYRKKTRASTGGEYRHRRLRKTNEAGMTSPHEHTGA